MGPAACLPHIPDVTAYQCVSLDQLENPMTRQGAAYWGNRCGGHRMPARDDINPREVVSALRQMALLKVVGDDFQYRVVGDGVVRAYSIPLQNRRLSEIGALAPTLAATARGFFSRVVHTAAPFAVRGQFGRDVPQANFTDFEIAYLPLGTDHHTVDHILTVSAYLMQRR
jgi:hypothetical protein